MILKSKITKEILNISYTEFKKKFAKELQLAFENYRQTQLNKCSYKIKDNNSIEQDFYFNLQSSVVLRVLVSDTFESSTLDDNIFSLSFKVFMSFCKERLCLNLNLYNKSF